MPAGRFAHANVTAPETPLPASEICVFADPPCFSFKVVEASPRFMLALEIDEEAAVVLEVFPPEMLPESSVSFPEALDCIAFAVPEALDCIAFTVYRTPADIWLRISGCPIALT